MPAPPKSFVDAYVEHVCEVLESFRRRECDNLQDAARRIGECLRTGGVVHLFGTGHSHMLAEEVFYRAGGLIPVDAMLDASVVLSGGAARSTATERRSGAAAVIASSYDLRRGDAGVVISHSGRNPAPVEMALLMKDRGMPVVAVTSVAHARALPPLDPPGTRLLDVADLVLDTGGDYGDAALRMPGVAFPVGPTSTAVGAAIVQCLMIAVIEHLVAAGEQVINLPSANVAGADLAPVLEELQRYRGRIRHL